MINTQSSKKVLFRLTSDMKKDFSVALVKHGIGGQHVLEAVVERVIAFNKGENLQPGEKKFISNIMKRSKELQAASKLQ